MPTLPRKPTPSMLLAAALAAACVQAFAQAALAAEPGLWRLTTQMSGGPRRMDPASADVCLRADALAAGVERAVLDAAPTPAGRERAGRAPSCTFADIRRDGTRSTWTVECESPLGTLRGTGSGSFEPARVDAAQRLQGKAPFGTMTLERRVSGTRVGDC